MNPTYDDRFEQRGDDTPSDADAGRFDGNGADSAGRGNPQRRLASALAPMRAALTQIDAGWRVTISPMRAFDALRIWPEIMPKDNSPSILYDVDAPTLRRAAQAAGSGSPSSSVPAALADRLGIPVIDRFANGSVTMESMALRELIAILQPDSLRCVLVDGPIEDRDASDIASAERTDRSPLDVEFRAVAAMEVRSDRAVVLDARDCETVVRLVAEGFRNYLAVLEDCPVSEVEAPEPWQIERLLEVSGSLTVRPIETDVFSTSIDVGISTCPAGVSRPADQSLIYDRPSNTWHDEP